LLNKQIKEMIYITYFTITVEYLARDTVIIEADSETDAREKAKSMDVFIEEIVSREALGDIEVLNVSKLGDRS
jgi:hypothetical protein